MVEPDFQTSCSHEPALPSGASPALMKWVVDELASRFPKRSRRPPPDVAQAHRARGGQRLARSLFGEFRQELMNADPRGVMRAAGTKPDRFYEPGFKAARQPDDVIEVARSGGIPAGTWLGEDKTGKGAFDIDQLVDLAKLRDPELHGFKRAVNGAAVAYKGEIFFFFSEKGLGEEDAKTGQLERILRRERPCRAARREVYDRQACLS